MMRLLITDMVRRLWRRPMLTFLAGVTGTWWLWRGHKSVAFGVSLAAAFVAGPLMTLPSAAVRAIAHLPVSRRDVWRAAWIVAVPGSVLLTTIAKLIGVLLPGEGTLALSSLFLSSTYDFAYAGIGCALTIVLAQPGLRYGARRYLLAPLHAAALLAFAGGPFWALALPILLPTLLPTRWAHISAGSMALLASALAIAAAGFFHAPRLADRGRRQSSQARRTVPRRFGHERLTGLLRLMLHEFAWSLGIGAVLLVALGLVAAFVSYVTAGPLTLAAFLRMQRLFIFSGSPAPARPPAFESFRLVFWFAFLATSVSSRFPAMIRHLRVLPLGTRRLNLLLVGWPVAVWLLVWVALLVLNVTVGDGVATLQLPLLVTFAGLSTLVHAITLRWPGRQPMIIGPAVVLAPGIGFMSDAHRAVFVALGFGALAIAVAINRNALSRAATYRPAVTEFAAAQTPR